ncbi:MAG: hypothetical protein LBL98_06310 [Ruminococcus sp.]|jgi:hypothetical protein|nr:hypothetical protein [Ruminococcus sp.]
MENQVKTAEELVEIFKANGKELSLETAEKIIAGKGKPELSDAELEAIAGGGVKGFSGRLLLLYPIDTICDAHEESEEYKGANKCCWSCKFCELTVIFGSCGRSSAPNFRRLEFVLSAF